MSTKSEIQPNLTSDHFSLELYRETLEKAKCLGYRFPTVSELRGGSKTIEKFLLVRHDIDTSPLYALRMAQLEHQLGVRSSYYFLMHSPFYNPGAPQHWDALREIVSLGFEVGLHYETDFFENRGLDPLTGILADAAALEKLLHIRITSVSQHRPASGTLLSKLNEFFIDAYNEDLMHNVFYISDSGFKWRDKTLAEVLGTHARIHALIHPLTWMFDEQDMAGTYERAGAEITRDITDAFRRLIASTNLYITRRQELDAARKAKYVVSGGPQS